MRNSNCGMKYNNLNRKLQFNESQSSDNNELHNHHHDHHNNSKLTRTMTQQI